MSRALNIISFNIQGLTSHKHVVLCKFIYNNLHLDIICIQETGINTTLRTIPGYAHEYKNLSANRLSNIADMLAIVIKNNINYQVITVDKPLNSSEEVHGLWVAIN